jgi:hypothetical protein
MYTPRELLVHSFIFRYVSIAVYNAESSALAAVFRYNPPDA